MDHDAYIKKRKYLDKKRRRRQKQTQGERRLFLREDLTYPDFDFCGINLSCNSYFIFVRGKWKPRRFNPMLALE